jgi:opacity protein-like surface antigen
MKHCTNWALRTVTFPQFNRVFQVILITSIAFTCHAAAQSLPTATRAGDLQIGGGFTFARSGYNFTPIHLFGETFYTTFSWKKYWGGEFDFHNVKASEDSTIYERTFEIGPRLFLPRGPVTPYAKVMYGRGIYNFSEDRANIAYNVYTFGGGLELAVKRSINVRTDYEYQNWAGFPLGTLHPSVLTIGLAYHVHE